MRYNILHFRKLALTKEGKKVLQSTFNRHSSTGVNLFSKDELTNADKKQIESYWKDKVNRCKHDESDATKEKRYILTMFPYPSGALHMGHVRIYTIGDAVARYYRLKGYNVIFPMGWDAFGLPAENAAIEKRIDPAKWTEQNIQKMKEQFKEMNYSFDWDREFSTCSPEYYRWTQDLFLKLYEKGLVYQKKDYVNWDPVDQTVLAEEQVDDNNRSWRSGAKVEKKLLKQWFIKTTAFAKSLHEGLSDPTLKDWRDIIKIQKNWIGSCKGVNFEFKFVSNIPNSLDVINLWTKHPEFIEYAKFVVISPNNILNNPEYTHTITENIKQLNAKVINPFTNTELPVYVSNKLPMPHERDNYLGIPATSMDDLKFAEEVGIQYDRHKIRTYEDQQTKLNEILQKAQEWRIGGYWVSSRLKDWLISRQRYWGTPIPMIHCKSCGTLPVPRDKLPVLLPQINYEISEKHYTLRDTKEWLETSCPNCGGQATRETDTMDTFVDSCWYFLRFIDPKNTKEMFATEKIKRYMPVDLYVGGKEHAALHLFFARFMSHFLYSENLVPTREPFRQLLVQGLVMGRTYKVKETGQYLKESEVEQSGTKYIEKATGKEVELNWEKMSKSKHNGVDPMDLLETYGIDVIRLLILADIAPTSQRNWTLDTYSGIRNWQHRMWLSIQEFIQNRTDITLEELQNRPTDSEFEKDDAYMFDSRNFFLKNVNFNMQGSQQLSIAISRMQGLTNSLRKVSKECRVKSREYERALAVQIIMLAPMAPHFASELWAGFCSAPHHLIDKNEVRLDKDVFEQSWPIIDMDYNMRLKIHMNSKSISIKIPYHKLQQLTTDAVMELLMPNSEYQKFITNKKIIDVKLDLQEGHDGNLYIKATNVDKPASEVQEVQA